MTNRISQYREGAGLTQQQLAGAAGWTQGRWSSYETGDRSPKPDVVNQIIKAFASFDVIVTFENLFVLEQAA
jgi:transcriptional regulator with XRE-family HTH domain